MTWQDHTTVFDTTFTLKHALKQIAKYRDNHPEELKEPCQKGYEMIGFKMKNGRRVPNCVPEE